MPGLLSWQSTTAAPSWTYLRSSQLLPPSKLPRSTRTTCSTTQKMFPYLGDRNTGYFSKSTMFGMALGERGLPTWCKYMTKKLFGASLSPDSIFDSLPRIYILPITILLFFFFF